MTFDEYIANPMGKSNAVLSKALIIYYLENKERSNSFYIKEKAQFTIFI